MNIEYDGITSRGKIAKPKRGVWVKQNKIQSEFPNHKTIITTTIYQISFG